MDYKLGVFGILVLDKGSRKQGASSPMVWIEQQMEKSHIKRYFATVALTNSGSQSTLPGTSPVTPRDFRNVPKRKWEKTFAMHKQKRSFVSTQLFLIAVLQSYLLSCSPISRIMLVLHTGPKDSISQVGLQDGQTV